MKKIITLAIAVILVAMCSSTTLAVKMPEKITVAYFREWPTANQVAQILKLYDKAMGLEIKWVVFNNGNEITQAMKSGYVQIAYSQGIVPYVVAVSNGCPLQLWNSCVIF